MNSLRFFIVILTLGVLSSCSEDDAPATPAAVATDVILYTDTDYGCGPISVTFNQVLSSQKLTAFYPDGIQCGSGSGLIFNDIPFGSYPFSALSDTGCQWEGQVTVDDNDDCVRFLIDESSAIESVCDAGWQEMPSCIEVIGIDTIDMNCDLDPRRVPRMTFRNNCTSVQKVVLCLSFRVMDSENQPDGLEVGEEDIFLLTCAGSFENSPIYSIDKTIYDQYGCNLSHLDCN